MEEKKKRTIEEIAKIIYKDFQAPSRYIAEKIYNAKYRKEIDTAREIIEWIKRNGTLGYGGYVIHDSTIDQICKKYGVEVE